MNANENNDNGATTTSNMITADIVLEALEDESFLLRTKTSLTFMMVLSRDIR